MCSTQLPFATVNIIVMTYSIAYTRNGSPPPGDEIISWHCQTWTTKELALEACDLDGWRGYVCEFPSGNRT